MSQFLSRAETAVAYVCNKRICSRQDHVLDESDKPALEGKDAKQRIITVVTESHIQMQNLEYFSFSLTFQKKM